MGLDDSYLLEIHAQITEELHLIETQIVEMRARADGLRMTLRGIEETTGMRMDGQLRGSEAVSYVYYDIAHRGEDHEGGVTLDQIVNEMRERGWLPDSQNPEGAIRSAIRRLRESDPHWRFSKSTLYYFEDPPTVVIPSVAGATSKGGVT